MKKLIGSLLLFVTTMIWGLAFTAQASAAESIGPFTFNTMRCILAGCFLLILIGFRSCIHKPKEKERRHSPGKKLIIAGTVCGTALFFGMYLQQAGIAAYPPQAAASGRAGFLTATYVVMVPLAQRLGGKKLRLPVIAAVIGCIGGMYLLCMSEGFSSIYPGDILELGCAVAFTVYILAVDRYTGLDGMMLSSLQFIVCGVINAVGMLLTEQPDAGNLLAAWLPIVYAGVLSSGVGYTLQIIGQKYAEPVVASLIMSLESVFAALSGWIILGEILSPRELLGCALVLLSVIAAQLPDIIKAARKKDTIEVKQ